MMFVKKRVLIVTMVFVLMFSLLGVALAQEMDFTVLFTNDTHGRVEEGGYAGMGFPKLATLVKDYRSEGDVLLLDSGDTFHGQTIVNLNEGEAIVHIMNEMGYDAMTLGNHDFNFGQERIKELDEMSDFPLLAANLDPLLVEPYVIKEIEGMKVGIFGLATPETTYKTHPKNVEGLTFRDPAVVAQEMVDELSGQVDMIIALAHLGISEESEFTSRKVAENVSGIDLIVDGHSHHALEEGMMVNNTLIVQAGEYDKNLGVVEVKMVDGAVEDLKASLVTKEEAEDVEKDSDILAQIEEIKAENEEITSAVVGKTSVELNGEREYVRTGETNLGNLLTDAMLAKVDADVAITNGGGIRASIGEGEITKGEIITVLPFGNTTIVKKLTGAQLLDVVEHGVSQYPAHEGLFPQVGGIRIIFDGDRPAGERVIDLKVQGEPIEYDGVYHVATNDFMAAGGDGYETFANTETVVEAGGLEEVLMEYISNKGTVAPVREGRIIEVDKEGNNYIYDVSKGDYLAKISKMFNVKIDAIMEANNIESANMIYVGQEIAVPMD
ncbi:MAG: 5'-nucleotidase C-terminal domain-containing protein [Halanaerobiales bacterium]|nr:5'-nucleotidase C-terminal domain-containing protein [Halanaerobiales bacterium]